MEIIFTDNTVLRVINGESISTDDLIFILMLHKKSKLSGSFLPLEPG